MNTAPAVRSRAQGQINRLGDAIAAPIRVRFARASHRTNGSRLHVIRALVKTKGVGMANDDMDNANLYVCNLEIMRMPALYPCRPSSTEYVMGEWCERKEGEANVHWHYPTVHFVQKQLIMAG